MTRKQRTARLAAAFKRMERQQDLLRDAQLALEAEFNCWAIGRRINRDVAREHLVSTGYLDPRMVRR